MTETITVIQLTTPCGFCMTGAHTNCRIETSPWFGKVWRCGCECDKSKVERVHTVNVPTMRPARVVALPEVEPAPAPVSKRQRRKDAKVTAAAQEVLDEIMASDEVQDELRKFDDQP
jgi:hypothetical protein